MNNKNNIIFIVIALIVLVAGYFVYSVYISSQTGLVDSEEHVLTKERLAVSKDFVAAINKIKKVEVDVAFFDSKDFKSLVDLTPELEKPEKVGRENPFLPLR